MAGTQLVAAKPSGNLSSVVRQTSCSRGWLRVVVQYFFGALTVVSFIWIVMMSMQLPSSTDDARQSHCYLQVCRIVCNDTWPSLYEDILFIATESELICPKLSLVFIEPYFVNETIPPQWLSNLRSPINRLAIVRGNLKYISAQAFMSLFGGNIEEIVFEGITITNFMSNTLVGLSSLRQLHVKKSNIINIRNALRAVDDSLEILAITFSGNWNPINISGSAEMSSLLTVDFSFNIFNEMLSNESFTGLARCRFLYLNSCNITAIRPGTFDYLHSIEVLYLNNNLLVTIPPALFDGLMNRINPKPRINLQDNPWNCDCESSNHLINLHTTDLLYVDAHCDTPEKLHEKPFSAIPIVCTNDSYAEVIVVDVVDLNSDKSNDVITTLKGDCINELSSNSTWKLITPDERYSCEKNVTLFSISTLLLKGGITAHRDIANSDWITPTYLIRNNMITMVQISSLTSEDFGILWFKSSCPNDIYCMSTLPNFLRVYDLQFDSEYTFCPVDLKHGYLKVEKCVNYELLTSGEIHNDYKYGSTSLFLYISVCFFFLAIGAVVVYGIIRYNPTLLKGSKRILFVKHRNVEALVLPPKVPLRSTLSNPDPDPNFNMTKIWVMPENEKNLSPRNFVRMKSTRSDKSTVSYISALQPTEDQLAEWRIKTNFDNNLTVSSDSEMSIISWINDTSSASEFISNTYESLK